jgi:hypothetical protein
MGQAMGRWVCLFLVALGVCLPAGAAAEDPGGRDGMQVHVDPQTGRLVPEAATPPAPAHPPALPAPAAEVPAPGGGMMAVLHGQFRSEAVATVEPDGRVRVECIRREAPDPTPR